MNMSFRPTMLSIREIASTFRSGLPASLDNVIDCIAAAVSNNILITFFPTERFGMSLFLPDFNSYVFLTLIARKNNLYQCLQDEHCVNRGQ